MPWITRIAKAVVYSGWPGRLILVALHVRARAVVIAGYQHQEARSHLRPPDHGCGRLLCRPWRARPPALVPTRVDLGRLTKSDDKVGESMTSVFHPGAKGLPVRDDPCRLNQPVRQNHGLVLNFEGD
jgi:hypothetical protein